jgi:hypothetical protein
MAETPDKTPPPSDLGGLEKDRQKAELYRPASILRTTEWGLLTVGSLLAGLLFPPYFVAVLWLAFFNAGGLLWVTHLSETGRLRLREFEREFSEGHKHEEAGHFRLAAEFYAGLVPKYQDFPKIAEIASRRIEHLKREHPAAFAAKPPKKIKGRK